MEKNLKLRSKTFAHQCGKPAISLPKTKLGSHIEGQLILIDENILPKESCEPLLKESAELTSIFIASRITA